MPMPAEHAAGRAGEGVPGVWGPVGGWRGYTGTPPDPSQTLNSVIFKVKGPTHGQMKAIMDHIHEVSQIWSIIDPD